MIDFFLQASSNTEALTRLQQTVGIIAVNLGAAVATCVVVLKFVNDLRASLKQARETAKQLINSKEEIKAASDRNYEAIQKNTAVTEKQAVEIQKHIVSRVRRELIPLSQRIAKLEGHLFTEDEVEGAKTQAWQADDDL